MRELECVYCGSDDIIKLGKDICFPFINILCGFCNIRYCVWDEVEYAK